MSSHPANITLTALPDIPLIHPGDDLVAATLAGLERADLTLQDGDVLVFVSKIVSKAEGRYVHLSDVKPTAEAEAVAASIGKNPRLVTLILQESASVLRTRPGLIVVEHRQGFISANAGIDHSNVDEDNDLVLLLPEDVDASARRLRAGLRQATGAEVAIVINDSHGRAWRRGTVGVAIGVAGLAPLTDKRGDVDLFGRKLRITMLGTADEIAAAASLLQGGTDEARPIVHMRGVPYRPVEGCLRDLLRPKERDMFR
ncbi:MAG: coenzyme F420-0:L-glutamate ligase [Clostridia bacterium]|nr:MAG: coenzyme F420-0:L-glutamate ligase [Clostridia bacterium]